MLTEIYYKIDEFCKAHRTEIAQCLYKSGLKRLRPSKLTLSEIMTIIVYHQIMPYRDFKHYYTGHVQAELGRDFPDLVSYERFVGLMDRALLPLCLFLRHQSAKSLRTGIYYVDSFPVRACHPKRAHQHKTMKGFAAWGKTSVGWFYGLKVHLVINQYGQAVNFLLTSGQMADNNAKVLFHLSKDLEGFLLGDRGYLLNDEKREFLERDGKLFIVSKDRKNMKKKELPLGVKLHLRKRGVVESAIGKHKCCYDIEHTRHRSPFNSMVNIMAAMVAYSFSERKPKTVVDMSKYAIEEQNQRQDKLAA